MIQTPRHPVAQSRKTLTGKTSISGFTLIELLVVIAIIAILAAILFPVFGRARENARRTSCQSNLKQIAIGMLQYTQDYDEKFPIYGHGGTVDASTGWAFTIQPYVKSTQLFQCPSESTGPSSNPGDIGYTDYAINLRLGYEPVIGPLGAKSLSVLTQPTLTVMNLDFIPVAADASSTWASGCDGAATCTTVARATFPTGVALRHLEGMNYSFTDGHVKWYKSANANTSASVWNHITPASTSSNGPTFNITP